MSDENKAKTLEVYGMPWWLSLCCVVICGITMYIGSQSSSMTGTLATCFALAVVFNEIGERLPIWNNYIGGGLLMAFFGVAILLHFGLIPDKAVANINSFISDDANFLEMFIVCLIVGSVLGLDKDILLKSFAGYIPAILGGLLCAGVLGILGGLLFGVAPSTTILKYVLPVMGGGNGAGAVPLSQIYEQVTGDASANYYAFAIIILTIANIFCIIASAGLNALGTAFDKKGKGGIITGDKKTLLRKGGNIARDDKKVKIGISEVAAALFLAVTCYSVGRLMSKNILPTIAGAAIHQYAYMIIFVVILAATGIIPENIRAGAKRLQSFMSGFMGIVIMVGMGADFNIAELFTALTPGNVVMALLIVIGAIIGAGGVGYLVGFYPIDSAITAGLCMANRGGNGDLACLGAADRMDLIAYAQLSSRLGGGIVLIIASFLFSFML